MTTNHTKPTNGVSPLLEFSRGFDPARAFVGFVWFVVQKELPTLQGDIRLSHKIFESVVDVDAEDSIGPTS